MTTHDDFKKLDLRVAEILDAQRVDGSEKLLKLKISTGDEERQILAGIAKFYEPEKLLGRQIIVVINLEPRKLMGEESQGMLLAAGDEEPILLVPDKEAPVGSKIR
ncbi:MAG: methionine--tRNA ligase subunit beta [Candidatus Portnoybacteria bacterium]|nr:methionine--tRNA ligase subunit beta [Candidatus Portnoybacteria bacterium]MDD4982367.1 methionine--tRNA ligase subunit beta [Candidatus Portnoybacteria bacterium]